MWPAGGGGGLPAGDHYLIYLSLYYRLCPHSLPLIYAPLTPEIYALPTRVVLWRCVIHAPAACMTAAPGSTPAPPASSPVPVESRHVLSVAQEPELRLTQYYHSSSPIMLSARGFNGYPSLYEAICTSLGSGITAMTTVKRLTQTVLKRPQDRPRRDTIRRKFYTRGKAVVEVWGR